MAAAAPPRLDRPSRQPWKCECGQAFLVTGRDRHRIHWPDGADESDLVPGDACPGCDRRLPVSGRGVPVAWRGRR